MHSRRFRPGLLLAVLAGLASCEINPQPPLPAGVKQPNPPGAAGSLNLGEGMSGGQAGPGSGGTGNDSSSGGSLVIDTGGGGPQAGGGGAGNAGVPTPGEGEGGANDAGGAGGATDAGGAGGANDAGGPIVKHGPR